MSVAATVPRRRRRPATRAHRIAVLLYAVLCVLVAGVALFPVRSGSLRLALISGLFGLWAGALFLFWDRIFVRVLCLAAAVAAGALALLPTLAIDTDSLRGKYVRSLQSYEGTRYVWGGETRLGMDCSGLVRAGLMEAETKEALRARNFVLLRKAASLWWNDASAKALSEEFQGRTRKLGVTRSLNEADYTLLKPGDLAVTAGGQHILAYTGDKTWIEADPGAGKVVSVRVPSRDGWFVQEATLLRWRILEPTAQNAEPR
ncbi:MAG: C40 family peptidase [Cytophagales bacterium]|nr:C40 family peptidase [Armatimonadota bacterium]